MATFPIPGDLRLNDSETGFVLASGTARLAQRLRIGLQIPLGSWRWDLLIGVPITEVEKLTPTILKSALRQFLLSFDEVIRVMTVAVSLDPEGLAVVEYTVLTNTTEVLSDSVPFALVS